MGEKGKPGVNPGTAFVLTLASINGVGITPLEDAIEPGRKMVEFRAEYGANAICRAIDEK